MTVTKTITLRPDGETWCKICGITKPQHAQLCSRLGADAIGLVFVEGSPRALTLDVARDVANAIRVTRMGLFVNADPELILEAIRITDLHVLQFQGDEDPDFCQAFGLPYVKAVRVQATTDLHELSRAYGSAMALQLDAYVDGVAGGTGQQFEWNLWPEHCNLPLILAGGLTPSNVGEAIRKLHPAGVDVSGGVESDVKGEKDPQRIRKFIQEVRNVRK